MNQCKKIMIMISRLLDNESSVKDRNEIKNHLQNCSECRGYHERLLNLQKFFSSFPSVKTSDDFNVLLRARIRRDLAGRSKIKTNYSFLTHRGFGIAITAAVVIFSLILFNPIHIFKNAPQSRLKISNKSGKDFDGNVQYVIDEYFESVSLSRDDNKNNPMTVEDSLIIHNNNNIKSRITPVNF